MKKGIKSALIFALGATVGSFVTIKYVSYKYEKEYQKELAAINEALDKKVKELSDAIDNKVDALNNEVEESNSKHYTWGLYEKPDVNELTELIMNEAYSEVKDELTEEEYGVLLNETKAIPESKEPHIYQISPDEFEELEGYTTKSVTYNVGTMQVFDDITDELIEDYQNHIGSELDDWIGEYSDQVLYVRNDIEKCDYEILFNYLG